MRFLWRISNRCELVGMGGEKASGRWHTAEPGKRVVYLSEHPAVALVETLANLHANPKLLPDRYQLMKVSADDSISTQTLPQEILATGWREQLNITRGLGDQWLAQRQTSLLIVPSAPSPESLNYVLNPLHPDATRLQIESCRWLKYDRRFFRGILPD